MGKARKEALRVDCDSRIKLEFHGAAITSDAGYAHWGGRCYNSGTSLGGVAGQDQMGNVGQYVLDELKQQDVLAVPKKGMRFNDCGCHVAR